jgi:transcriptional regulator with XRE-family HTH domain
VSQLSDFLGRQVKKRRKTLKLSQEDVAAKTGLSVPSLSEIERGIANPTLLTLEKIAGALGVSVAAMLDADGVLVTSPEQMKLRVLEHLERMNLEQLKMVTGLLDISTK